MNLTYRFHRRAPLPSHAHQRGFGLVEAMIGMVISLMATLAIFQTFAINEDQRRTTGSGSEALQAGTLAMAQIQKTIRNAGFNMLTPTDPSIRKPTRTVVEGTGAVITNADPVDTEFLMGCFSNLGMRITPALVTGGASPLLSDTIVLMEGSSSLSPIPSRLVTATVAGATSLTLDTTFGYQPNDNIIIYEQSSTINVGNTRPVQCTFTRVASLPSSPVIAPAVVNLTSTTTVPYSSDARVVNLGRNPIFQRISVANNRLMLTNLVTGTQQALADNVMSMKVQVGIDVGNDDVIDEWINPPTNANTWLNPNATPAIPVITALPVVAAPRALNQIKAMRIGLLIRSPNFEKPAAVSGQCETTGPGPFSVLDATLGNSGQRIPAMPSSGSYNWVGNERCYRYNTLTSVVPLRNFILSDI
jgi:type IV pilus assembly protein PilW